MRLTLKKSSTIPLFAECLSPDTFCDKTVSEIGDLECLHGNRVVTLGDFFKIDEDGSNIEIVGDVSFVRHIGAKMTLGKMSIRGNVGMHLGAEMSGGEITVAGDVSDWCGAEMKGGRIEICGNAGNFLGGAYRGSEIGMNRGTIIVTGNAGHECGLRMKRGLISVQGNLGDFAGLHMKGGTLICYGSLGIRTGAFMDRGTIICYTRPTLMATFRLNSAYNPVWLRFFLKTYSGFLPVRDEHITGLYERYTGDITELGKGEILVWKGRTFYSWHKSKESYVHSHGVMRLRGL
jgi:formylmethanofuran dehydrogenase subunit C